MLRSELVKGLSTRFPQLGTEDVEVTVKEILEAISGALIQGRRVEIRGFGSFSLNYRPARRGRNPKTGEAVWVPRKASPHFRPGKEMRALVGTV